MTQTDCLVIGDSRDFRDVMSCFASGVTVVTTVASDGCTVGITVSAFTSLSLEPPLVLVCLNRKIPRLKDFIAGPFAVNILNADQKDLSVKFSEKNSMEKWSSLDYGTWETGAPILKGCLANIECSTELTYDGGDHVIIVGRVHRSASNTEKKPLLYFHSKYSP